MDFCGNAIKRAGRFFLILTAALIFSAPFFAYAEESVEYLYREVPEPELGSVGGEWTVMAVSAALPSLQKEEYSRAVRYLEGYYNRIKKQVAESNGILSEDSYTEYSRVALALQSIEKDPKHVSGYSLIRPLQDYRKVLSQGINGAAFALMALDKGKYAGPREYYIDALLSAELPEGGWSYYGRSPADPDMTAIVICALSPYTERVDVRKAVERGEICLDRGQPESSESLAWMILAQKARGRSWRETAAILEDYRLPDGSYRHLSEDEEGNVMSTEQALYALKK